MPFQDDTGLNDARRRMIDTISDLEQLEHIGDNLFSTESPRLAAERYEKVKIADQLESAERTAQRSRAAWEAEKKALRFKAAAVEQALEESRANGATQSAALQKELDALRRKFESAQTSWQTEEKRLQGRLGEIEEQRLTWEKTRDELVDERAGLRERLDTFRAEIEGRLIKATAALERETNLREQTETLREGDRQALKTAQTLLSSVQDQTRLLQKALDAARKDSGEALPPLHSELDPAWAAVLARLENPVANAYAHLRRLAKTPMAAGARTVLKLAAGELVAVQDHLHGLRQYLEEVGPAPGPGQLEPLLSEVLGRWEPVLRRRRIVVLRKIGALPQVVFDAESMRGALHQLLKNVHEALQHGGTLTVEALRDEKGGVQLTFSDTGPGFPEEVLADPFTPFGARSAGRLGLGLPLVRRTVRAVGGDAATSNKEPRGAVVTLNFPPLEKSAPIEE
jgi:signal transduction histidine kinase